MYAVIALCLGLAAAAMFGAASVLEERSTKQVPERAALSPRLLLDLVRRPLFLASIAVNVAGAGLQVLALHFGSLTLVQPLLVLSLLFAVVIAAMVIRRRRPDVVLLAGVAGCAAGIAGFLAVARPHGGADTADPTAAVPLAAGLAAVLAGCLAAPGGGRGRCGRCGCAGLRLGLRGERVAAPPTWPGTIGDAAHGHAACGGCTPSLTADRVITRCITRRLGPRRPGVPAARNRPPRPGAGARGPSLPAGWPHTGGRRARRR